ncbi:murein hydrolase activator EnvC family protein [Microbacterium sp. 1S1]|uniref:murein hydrolase activator EnvC family protein n=1 Tax=Microbacterium sp. 1S1 TaxID=2606451 RepID=UPI0011EB22B3|nr:M23 family metallopeptidase [Microbacterium sp. 1S1]
MASLSHPRPRLRAHPSSPARRTIAAVLGCFVLLGSAAPLAPPPSAQATTTAGPLLSPEVGSSAEGVWRWPLDGTRRVSTAYRAPAHAYGPGHRGIDVTTTVGAAAVAPADGVVAFQGVVVDRPVLTIRHADGLVSTFEPLESSLRAGESVRQGQGIGRVSVGGHASPGSLHVGVRYDGTYINPMLLFEDVPRARLLPCCDP